MFISHYKLANYEVDLNNNQLFQVPLTFANLNSHLLNLFKLFKINTNWSWIRSTCAIGEPETQHDIKCNHKQAQFAATTAFRAGHLQKKKCATVACGSRQWQQQRQQQQRQQHQHKTNNCPFSGPKIRTQPPAATQFTAGILGAPPPTGSRKCCACAHSRAESLFRY